MNTAPWVHRATQYCAYHLALRPRLRRICTLWFTTHLLATWSVLTAPSAAASTLTGALNWTGITDSHGVPVGSYYLSLISTSEAITKAGPDVSADPSTWTRWLANTMTTGLTHDAVAQLLQAEAGIYIFMIATSLWLLRFAMSNQWLYWLTTWFRPLFEVIRSLLNELWVFPLCMLAGLAVGAFHTLWHGRKGHGSSIILSTFVIGILGLVLTKAPLSDLSDENGLIGRARALGFQVAQAFITNGSVAGGGTNAAMQHITGLIADATLRTPLQLMNFGTTVDDIGTCGNAYTTAILAGQPDGPAHAMGSCGAHQALTFAQHLDGGNLALGLFYLLLGAVFSFFVLYLTYSYVMVCYAAFLNAFLAVVSAAPAMVHGRPRQRALRRLRLFFKHAFLVFTYTTYISVAAIIILKMAARGGYADQVGMTHPLARLIMIGLVSAVAIGGLWWLKRELGDHTRHDTTQFITDLTRASRQAYQRGRDRAQQASELPRKLLQGNTTASGGAGGDDPPLTGPPVQGRPPGGRPPGNRPHGGPAPNSGAPTHGPGAAQSGPTGTRPRSAGVAAKAATVLAPEAAAAGGAATRLSQQRPRAAGGRSATSTRPGATQRRQTTGAPAADSPVYRTSRESGGYAVPDAPMTGRTANAPTPDANGAAHPGRPDPENPPAQGRGPGGGR